jgi:CrcB protein
VTPLAWVGFVVAGAIGAPVRYLLDGFVQDRTGGAYPWGTFAINVSGSFVLGVITGLALHHGLSPAARTIFGTGLCGAYTTFSTFSFETVRLVEEGDAGDAARNVVASLSVGLAAAALGLFLASLG